MLFLITVTKIFIISLLILNLYVISVIFIVFISWLTVVTVCYLIEELIFWFYSYTYFFGYHDYLWGDYMENKYINFFHDILYMIYELPFLIYYSIDTPGHFNNFLIFLKLFFSNYRNLSTCNIFKVISGFFLSRFIFFKFSNKKSLFSTIFINKNKRFLNWYNNRR